jgi:EAL domain-containing protein (putative c-di-GMP-specific phosphodiesterase class I)
LQGLGINIAIDDFGTGFSSLSYLDRLPINRIKIDRSFVNSMMLKKGGMRITELVIQLGHSLGMRIIAEGVEDEKQARCLLNMGCQEAQGFLYARPMVGDDLKKWLRNYSSVR